MATAQSIEEVQKLFIAYYGRPADPAGLNFWAARLDAAGGSLSGIIDSFADSAESVALYGNIVSTEARIAVIYRNVLGRDPDAEGLAFYTQLVTSGQTTLGNLALDVLNGARNDDAILMEQKLSIAQQFTQKIATGDVAYNGDVAAAVARALLQSVTSDGNAQLVQKLDAYVNTVRVASTAPEMFAGKIENGVLKDTSIVSETLEPSAPTPTPGGGGGGGGGSTPTFTVTNTDGTVTFANGSGDITVTVSGDNTIFTRGGVEQTVATAAITTKITVASGQVLTGTAAVLTGRTIDGAGTVAVTALHATANANLSNITATTVTANATTSESTPTYFVGSLGKAAVTISGDGIFSLIVGGPPTLGTATFVD